MPDGGMQTVSDQLAQKALELGVEIRLNSSVLSIHQLQQHDTKDERFSILIADDGKVDGHRSTVLNAKSVVVATDYNVARSLLQDMSGLESPPCELKYFLPPYATHVGNGHLLPQKA